MASVSVSLPGPLRRFVDGLQEVAAEGGDIREVLRSLAERHPELACRILDDGGEPRRFVRLFLNEADLSTLDGMLTQVRDGDLLVVVIAAAGG